MGKSFNDDVFNNSINLESINGLNISKEAIEENQTTNKLKIDLADIGISSDEELDQLKEQLQEEIKMTKTNTEDDLKELIQYHQSIKERKTDYTPYLKQEDKAIYVKKTMIFKQEYLDIIDGLASINNMQIKDVLNQLLDKAINELDSKVKDKALKTGKNSKTTKESKNIF